MHDARASWRCALTNLLTPLRQTEGEPEGSFVPGGLRQQPPGFPLYAPSVLEFGNHSLPFSLPSARQVDVAIKKPRYNLLLQRGLQCRGDWIRTSDLLNPIQAR
jgi:hypothetical protein